jgi:hypothetical protein
MSAEPTEPQLDRALLQLRIVLANALTVTDAIRALRPGGIISCRISTPNYRRRSVRCGVPARC